MKFIAIFYGFSLAVAAHEVACSTVSLSCNISGTISATGFNLITPELLYPIIT